MNRNTTEIIEASTNSRTIVLPNNISSINRNALVNKPNLRSVIFNEGLIALE